MNQRMEDIGWIGMMPQQREVCILFIAENIYATVDARRSTFCLSSER